MIPFVESFDKSVFTNTWSTFQNQVFDEKRKKNALIFYYMQLYIFNLWIIHSKCKVLKSEIKIKSWGGIWWEVNYVILDKPQFDKQTVMEYWPFGHYKMQSLISAMWSGVRDIDIFYIYQM